MKHYVLAVGVLIGGLVFAYRGEIRGFARHEPINNQSVTRINRPGPAFVWRGGAGVGLLEVRGVNGGIEAVGTQGAEIVVRAHKVGRRSDPSTVRIEVVEHADGVTICSVYPRRDQQRVCAGGEGATPGSHNNDVSVEYRVEIPRGVRFHGSTVNGFVRAEGLSDHVRASSVNGSIRIETDGWADASTVNGSIRAELGEHGHGGDLRFHTTNGQITLLVPDGVAASFRGATMSGGIRSDFPFVISGRSGRSQLEGMLGGGGELISLETVNGSIRILRR